ARAVPARLGRREALLAALARLQAGSGDLALGLYAALAHELIDAGHATGDSSSGPGLGPCNTRAVIRFYRAAFSTNCERVALALAHTDLEVHSAWIAHSD